MHDLKITVVIPVYNSSRDLPKCLDSVLGQTYRNLEILLINDGSTDQSGQVCDKYAKSDDRIRCVHQENKGVSAARNRGIEMGTGDYYHFLDSDDYLEADAYEYMISEMKKSGAEAVGFEYYVTYHDKEIVHSQPVRCYGLKDTAGSIYTHMFENNDFLCTKLLPARVVKPLRFYENIYRDEDTLFGWQALRMISSCYFLKRPLLHYVQSEESACRGKFRVSQLSAVKVIPIVEEFLSKEYPQWLNLWRIGYMHLMIMLYTEMYMDEQDLKKEMEFIFATFCKLLKDTKLRNIKRWKSKIKFTMFRLFPGMFCCIHKLIHRL